MTRRLGHLRDKILSDENLDFALHQACLSNGRTSPAKRKAIEYVRTHPDECRAKLKEFFLNPNRAQDHYAIHCVIDPKLRLIYATSFFPFRVAHWAVMHIVAPYWDSLMDCDSYACREGMGQHKAGLTCAAYIRRFKYVAQFDISQFYVSIDHGILKRILRRKLKDKFTLEYLDQVIDSISTRDTNLRVLHKLKQTDDVKHIIAKLNRYKQVCGDRKAGIPTGNFPSQWFGNLYMNELDEFLRRNGVKNFVRYCDDFIIFSNDKAFLHDIRTKVTDFLWEHLHLLLSKAEIYPTRNHVDFCGYVYVPNGTVKLRKRTAVKQSKIVLSIGKELDAGTIDPFKARERLASIIGWFKYAQTAALERKLDLPNIYRKVINLCKDSAISPTAAR